MLLSFGGCRFFFLFFAIGLLESFSTKKVKNIFIFELIGQKNNRFQTKTKGLPWNTYYLFSWMGNKEKSLNSGFIF